MSATAAEVERALLALDQRVLAAVIHRGLRSLDPAGAEAGQEDVDSPWHIALEQRLHDLETGEPVALDVDQSHARLRTELRSRRE